VTVFPRSGPYQWEGLRIGANTTDGGHRSRGIQVSYILKPNEGALDSRFRGNDIQGGYVSLLGRQQSRLVPAQAGIQAIWNSSTFWIPAFAGMTPFSWLRLSRLLPQGERRFVSFG